MRGGRHAPQVARPPRRRAARRARCVHRAGSTSGSRQARKIAIREFGVEPSITQRSPAKSRAAGNEEEGPHFAGVRGSNWKNGGSRGGSYAPLCGLHRGDIKRIQCVVGYSDVSRQSRIISVRCDVLHFKFCLYSLNASGQFLEPVTILLGWLQFCHHLS